MSAFRDDASCLNGWVFALDGGAGIDMLKLHLSRG